MFQTIMELIFRTNTVFAIIICCLILGILLTILRHFFDENWEDFLFMMCVLGTMTIITCLMLCAMTVDDYYSITTKQNLYIGDSLKVDTLDIISLKQISDDIWNVNGKIHGGGLYVIAFGGMSMSGEINGGNKIIDYYVFYTLGKDNIILRNKINIENTVLINEANAHYLVKYTSISYSKKQTLDNYIYRDKDGHLHRDYRYKQIRKEKAVYKLHIDKKYIGAM